MTPSDGGGKYKVVNPSEMTSSYNPENSFGGEPGPQSEEMDELSNQL